MTELQTIIIPKQERKSRSLTMVIEPSLLDNLDVMAKTQRVTRSEAARFILASFFAQNPQILRVIESELQVDPQ